MRSKLLVTAILLSLGSNAQEQCTSHGITMRHLAAKGLGTDLRSALRQLPKGTPKGGGVTVIPVVVHVVWNTPAENVPDAAILAMMDGVNADYSANNSDIVNVRPAFTAVVTDTDIQFCLASVDPNGDPTTGITRTQTTETWFDPDTETDDMKSPPKGISPWDPDHYLNIWICDITSGAVGGAITVGYAYLPVPGIPGSSIDGLVVDQEYGIDPLSRTATHEVGHYLGLLHPWGNGGCMDDDGHSDTPDTDSPTFSCSNSNLMKCGVLTQFENFMDYANCTVMFTQEQGAAMNNVLFGARATLLNSNGCGVPPVADLMANTTTIAPGGTVDFTDLSSNSPTQWAWTFLGGVPGSSTDQDPADILYPDPGCYSVELTATNAFGSDTETRTCYIDVNTSTGTPTSDANAPVIRYDNGWLALEWPEAAADRLVTVYDMAGRRTAFARVNGSSHALSMTGADAGAYLLCIEGAAHRVVRRFLHLP